MAFKDITLGFDSNIPFIDNSDNSQDKVYYMYSDASEEYTISAYNKWNTRQKYYPGVFQLGVGFIVPAYKTSEEKLILQRINIMYKTNISTSAPLVDDCSCNQEVIIHIGSITKTANVKVNGSVTLSNNGYFQTLYIDNLDIDVTGKSELSLSFERTYDSSTGDDYGWAFYFFSGDTTGDSFLVYRFEENNTTYIKKFSFTIKSTGQKNYCDLYFYDVLNNGFVTNHRFDFISGRDYSSVLVDSLFSQMGGGTIKDSYESTQSKSITVEYYVDSSLSDKIEKTVLPTPYTFTVKYNTKKNTSGNHYWKISNGNTEFTSINLNPYKNGSTVSFVLIGEKVEEGGKYPTYPLNFPQHNREGYRSLGGDKYNKDYYNSKTDAQINPGDVVSESELNSNYVSKLYLKWEAKNYTIKFEKGTSNSWNPQGAQLGSIQKTYGQDISDTDDRYPENNARAITVGKLQYGWVSGKEVTGKDVDKVRCTYSYDAPYNFSKQTIDDTWYDDNLDVVTVYPCWVPINHKVVQNYYIKSGNTISKKTVNTDFNIDTGYKSFDAPSQKSTNWNFLGWSQGVPPKGDDWEWGTWTSADEDLRDCGVFRYISDLEKAGVQYAPTYGINSTSLTNAEWDDLNKNLYIYGLYNVNGRAVFIDGKWHTTTGMWVYVDGKWRMIDTIYRKLGDDVPGWVQEIVK